MQSTTPVTIELFGVRPDDASLFRAISEEWLFKYFEGPDPSDEEQMGNPMKIIEDGGYLCMARIGAETVGTGGLIKRDGKGVFEIAKMGVKDTYQGRGVGKAVLEHIISHAARSLGAKILKIESSSKLASALHLYKKYGFVDDPDVHTSFHDYKDADIFLQLVL